MLMLLIYDLLCEKKMFMYVTVNRTIFADKVLMTIFWQGWRNACIDTVDSLY